MTRGSDGHGHRSLLLTLAGAVCLGIGGCGRSGHTAGEIESFFAKGDYDALLKAAKEDPEPFVDLIEGTDPRRAADAAETLSIVGSAPAGRLRPLLRSGRLQERFWARRVLVTVDPLDPEGLDDLLDGIASDDVRMQSSALIFLLAHGPRAEWGRNARVAEVAGRVLNAPEPERAPAKPPPNDPYPRDHAAHLLADLGAAGLPELIRALEGRASSWFAFGALAGMGPTAQSAMPALERAMNRDWDDGGQRAEKARYAFRKIRGW